MEAHGSDVVAMARDLKLNALQHTPAKLKEMLESYAATVGGGAGPRFRAPVKCLGKFS